MKPCLRLALALLLALHPRTLAAQEPATTATLTGIVTTAAGTAVSGATIELQPTGRTAQTDSAGIYSFSSVASGRYTLHVTRLGFAAHAGSVTVAAAGEAVVADVVLAVEAIALESVVVGAGQFGVRYGEPARAFEVGRAELDMSPQITADPFRVLGSIPAVASSDFSARVSVRGRPQTEMAVLLDGVELYEPFHVKEYDGSISTIPTNSLAGMRLQAGGYGARWGGRSAAILELETAHAGTRPLMMSADLGGAAVAVGGDLGSSAGWLGSARYGFLSTLMSLAGSDEDVSPTYGDGLVKAAWEVAPDLRLGALYFGAFDRNRLNTEEDGAFRSHYSNQLVSLRVDAELRGARLESVASHTWLASGRNAQRSGSPGYDIEDTRATSVFALDQTVTAVRTRVVWRLGVQSRWFRSEFDYVRRQLDAPDRSVELQARPDLTEHGAFVSARFRPARPLTVESGVRYDAAGAARQFSPRVAAALDVGPATVRLGGGRYFQVMRPQDLAVADGDTSTMAALRPITVVGGVELPAFAGSALRIEAYRTRAADAPARWVNLDGGVEPVAEAREDRVRIDPAEFRSMGVELWLEREPSSGLRWSLGYTRSSSQEKIGGQWMRTPDDQPNAFTASLGYLTAGWSAATSWTYHSGRPTTPATFSLEPGAGPLPRVVPTFGAYNSDALPAYHRLDVRVARTFNLTMDRALLVYANVFNAYNRANALAYSYSIMPAFPRGEPVISRAIEPMLPIMPSAGIGFSLR